MRKSTLHVSTTSVKSVWKTKIFWKVEWTKNWYQDYFKKCSMSLYNKKTNIPCVNTFVVVWYQHIFLFIYLFFAIYWLYRKLSMRRLQRRVLWWAKFHFHFFSGKHFLPSSSTSQIFYHCLYPSQPFYD